MVQVHTAHAELLLLYREPPGPRTDRILALYDQNKNGELDGLEQRLARRLFLQRAFFGLEIDFGYKRAEKTANLRFKRDADGGISVAIFQRIDLIIDSNEMTLKLAVRKGETIPPIDIIVEPVDWTLQPARPAEKERKVSLKPGQSESVNLSRRPTAVADEVPRQRLDLPPLPQ